MSNERRDRLEQFTEWCQQYITGDEKSEAQIFLDRFFQAFGHDGLLEAGGAAEFRIKKASEDGGGTSFADCVWKPHVLIEMKKRGEDLSRHYRQAFDYWTRLVPGRPHYVVLCNFDEFWVYDFDTQLDTPVDKVPIKELPDRFGPLAFLFPTHETPIFGNDNEKVTREAAGRLGVLFRKLKARDDVGREKAQRFVLQLLVALFAEDIGLLEPYTIERLAGDCHTPEDSYELFGGLFIAMNEVEVRDGGRYKGVQYFNGGLFANPARIELAPDELNQIKEAARENWSKVRPEIFGTIFEQTCNQDERHAFGAHFTSAVDIYKIIRPTITEPWEQLIDKADTLKRLRELHQHMQAYRVLDPACGSGNFLYLAYRELKRLEKKLIDKLAEVSKRQGGGQGQFSFVTTRQFFGMDINPFAVELAKVTMMLAHKLAIDELHIDEPALPLDNLDENIRCCDALITPRESPFAPPPLADPPEHNGKVPTAWPDADVIIGNPPFLDARKTTMEHGSEYTGLLERFYPDIGRRSDLCVYWFRRAHDHLPTCTPEMPFRGRAGLVGTQNVRNNDAREGGLDHIVTSGTIVEAVDNQPWSGEANVHVSIANWVKHSPPSEPPRAAADARDDTSRLALDTETLIIPKKKKLWFKVESMFKGPRKRGQGPATKDYELNYRECERISAALSDQTDVTQSSIMQCNRNPKVVFEGVQTGHKGFVINKSEAQSILQDHPECSLYLKPFLNGSDLLSGKYVNHPEYVIDLSKTDILTASTFPYLLKIIQERVLPDWTANAEKENMKTGKDTGEHQNRLKTWWALKRPRMDLQDALDKHTRVIACSAVMKRNAFVFLESNILPTNAIKVFVFDDDDSFGVIQSGVHWQWFVAKCSKLKSDFRYTPESVFDTFPWPQSPSAKDIDAVAEAGREVRQVRGEALKKIKGGLRAVYRTLELPGKNPLRDAHAALDAAVMQAYGFSAKKDLLQQLLDLNLDVAEREKKGELVTAPGVPADYPDPKKLVTDDCIRP